MRKFVLSPSANVREFPSLTSKILATLYKNDTFPTTGRSQYFTDLLAGEVAFKEIEYKPGMFGWVYAGLLGDYVDESEPIVSVPEEIKTKEFDAEQYVIWDGAKKTNLCGLFCAAYLAGEGIGESLKKLKSYSPGTYTANVTNNKPVGLAVIRTFANMFEMARMELKALFEDKVVGEFYSIQGFMNGLKEGWKPILGCKIGLDGKLNGSIGHWVVLNEVSPMRNGDGIVMIYNPFSNRLQKYSYAELVKSMTSFGGYVGLWVSPKTV